MSKFPYPLNTEILEEIEVDAPSYELSEDKKSASFKTVKKKVQVRTTYIKADEQKMMCKRGEHNWVMLDKHKYIIKCTNDGCIKHRILNPIVHQLKDGHLISRYTKEVID